VSGGVALYVTEILAAHSNYFSDWYLSAARPEGKFSRTYQ
jgi:hypothetical protein